MAGADSSADDSVAVDAAPPVPSVETTAQDEQARKKVGSLFSWIEI